MVPRRKSSPRIAARPEVGAAVQPEMAAAAAKKIQLTTYVSEKNLRRDRMMLQLVRAAVCQSWPIASPPSPCTGWINAQRAKDTERRAKRTGRALTRSGHQRFVQSSACESLRDRVC